jgi:hypothetical protein
MSRLEELKAQWLGLAIEDQDIASIAWKVVTMPESRDEVEYYEALVDTAHELLNGEQS